MLADVNLFLIMYITEYFVFRWCTHAELANLTKYTYIVYNIFYYYCFYLDYDYDYTPQIFSSYRLYQITWLYVIDYSPL